MSEPIFITLFIRIHVLDHVESRRCDPLQPAAGRSRVLRLLPIGLEAVFAAMSVTCMKTVKNRATHIVDTNRATHIVDTLSTM